MIRIEQPLEAVSKHLTAEVIVAGYDPRSYQSWVFLKDLLEGFSRTPRIPKIDADLAAKLAQLTDEQKMKLASVSLVPPFKKAMVLPETTSFQPYLNMINQGLKFPWELEVNIGDRKIDSANLDNSNSINQAHIDLLKEAQRLGIELFSRDFIFGGAYSSPLPSGLDNPHPFTRVMITCATVGQLLKDKYRVMVLTTNPQADKSKSSLAYHLSIGFPDQVVSVSQFDGTLGPPKGYERFFQMVKKEGFEERTFALSYPETQDWGVLSEVAVYYPKAIVAKSQVPLLES